MSSKPWLLITGAAGFIGRNLLERFAKNPAYSVAAVWHQSPRPRELIGDPRIRWIRADLTQPAQVRDAVSGADIVLHAAATTSGSKDIVERPSRHVTDNAVMNSLLFRACHEQKVKHAVFFSCSVMYSPQDKPVRESDFRYEITAPYFGVGWTKVYSEKMCEFYSRLGTTRFTAIRHSNIYGPHDKYDLEKSHVFGATLAKVMSAEREIVVWGEGTEERDLLHVDDLADFVEKLVTLQKEPFELINVGSGRSVAVRDLAAKIIELSGRKLEMRFDRSKPSIPFKLALDSGRAKKVYGWSPSVSLEEGIRRSLQWYREHVGAAA